MEPLLLVFVILGVAVRFASWQRAYNRETAEMIRAIEHPEEAAADAERRRHRANTWPARLLLGMLLAVLVLMIAARYQDVGGERGSLTRHEPIWLPIAAAVIAATAWWEHRANGPTVSR